MREHTCTTTDADAGFAGSCIGLTVARTCTIAVDAHELMCCLLCVIVCVGIVGLLTLHYRAHVPHMCVCCAVIQRRQCDYVVPSCMCVIRINSVCVGNEQHNYLFRESKQTPEQQSRRRHRVHNKYIGSQPCRHSTCITVFTNTITCTY